MEILHSLAILLLIILVIVVGNKYVNNEIYTYEKTKNNINLKFIRIGNLVKIKVSTTIASDDIISKLIQLSNIPDWAKPDFEEKGTIANSTTAENWSKESSETSFSASKTLYASFVKVNANTYRMIVAGGNGETSAQEVETFIYYLCR